MDCPIDYFANKRARTAPRGGRAAPPPAPAELLGPRDPRQAARRGSRLQPGGDLSSPESGPVTRHIFAGSEAGEPHGPGRAGPRRLGPPASTPSGQSPLEPYRLGGPPGAPASHLRGRGADRGAEGPVLRSRAGADTRVSPQTSRLRGSRARCGSGPHAPRGQSLLAQTRRKRSGCSPGASCPSLAAPGAPAPVPVPAFDPGGGGSRDPGQHLLGL